MAPHQKHTLTSQASDWLARLQGDELSGVEREEFDAWLDASPENAVAFARVEHAWERAERLRAASGAAPPAVFRGRKYYWAAAAALALVVLGSWFVVILRQANVYCTDIGERRTISLADGSQVNLNTASSLRVELSDRQRVVRLMDGEALFKVTRDPARPFIVEAADSRIRVIGTAFNVRMRGRLVEVTVTEGVVSVDGRRLAAGSAVIAAAGAIHQVPLGQDVLRRRVVWRDGAIELKGETLEQAVEEFNRYRADKLVVADSTIANIRVGGRFETDEAEKFLSAVSASFPVRVVKAEDGRVYLFGQP